MRSRVEPQRGLVVLVIFVSYGISAHDSEHLGAGFADRHAGGHVSVQFLIDNLSLMALIVATGFVVDDSIVMIENIRAISRWAIARWRPR